MKTVRELKRNLTWRVRVHTYHKCVVLCDHINKYGGGGGGGNRQLASYMCNVGDVPMTTTIKYYSFSDSINARNVNTLMMVAGRDTLM